MLLTSCKDLGLKSNNESPRRTKVRLGNVTFIRYFTRLKKRHKPCGSRGSFTDTEVYSASFLSQYSSSRKVVLCTNTRNLTALLSHLGKKKNTKLLEVRIQDCSISMSLKRAFAFSAVLEFTCCHILGKPYYARSHLSRRQSLKSGLAFPMLA